MLRSYSKTEMSFKPFMFSGCILTAIYATSTILFSLHVFLCREPWLDHCFWKRPEKSQLFLFRLVFFSCLFLFHFALSLFGLSWNCLSQNCLSFALSFFSSPSLPCLHLGLLFEIKGITINQSVSRISSFTLFFFFFHYFAFVFGLLLQKMLPYHHRPNQTKRPKTKDQDKSKNLVLWTLFRCPTSCLDRKPKKCPKN